MSVDFHFNEWAFLAQTDPVLFEQRRRDTIAAFIDGSGGHKERLRALQAKLDEQRELAVTPERTLAMLAELMCASLSELGREMGGLLKEVQQLMTALEAHAASQTAAAPPCRLAA